MSLVNNYLKDIQNRRAHREPNVGETVAGTETAEESHFIGIVGARGSRFAERSHLVPLLVAATCVVVIAAEGALRFAPSLNQGVESETQTPAVSSRPPIIELADRGAVDPPGFAATRPASAINDNTRPSIDSIPEIVETASPERDFAQLLGLQVEPHRDFTRVRLHLSQERDYWIQGDPTYGEVEVVISGTRLSRAFSPGSFVGTGLTLRETHNTSEGLHLVLGFEPRSQVQSQFIDDASGSQLVLDVLSDRRAATIAAEPKTAPAKGSRTSWGSIDQNRSSPVNSASEAIESLNRARGLEAQNRPVEAAAEYIRALSLDSDLHRARENLVAYLIESGQLRSAEQHLDEGASRAPGHSEYTLLRAQLLVAMKQTRRAIALLEGSPTPENRRSDALNLLAALYQQEGNHERAEALFRDAVRLAPHEGRLWMGLGISLEGQQRNTEALAIYQQAQSLANFGDVPRSWLQGRINLLTKVE